MRIHHLCTWTGSFRLARLHDGQWEVCLLKESGLQHLLQRRFLPVFCSGKRQLPAYGTKKPGWIPSVPEPLRRRRGQNKRSVWFCLCYWSAAADRSISLQFRLKNFENEKDLTELSIIYRRKSVGSFFQQGEPFTDIFLRAETAEARDGAVFHGNRKMRI